MTLAQSASDSSDIMEKNKKVEVTEEEEKKDKAAELDLDSVLSYGSYQRFQIWVLQFAIAIIGAINYYHIVFLVSDPPEWKCKEEGAQM